MTINILDTNLTALDVLKKRQVRHLPKHFVKTFVQELDKDEIRIWIQNKLKGRYFFGRTPRINSEDKLVSDLTIAFEDKKEMTYFMLACPYQRRN
jgi:hypothetical protein